jgi:hypothetical protein
MSYLLDENKPNSKSCQRYHFKHPWEIKHAIGVNHKKHQEFLTREGIKNIHIKNGFGKYGLYDDNKYGQFVIEGKPNDVDKLMIKISEWLKNCQCMHYQGIGLILFYFILYYILHIKTKILI